jgi:hypothetical protein
MPAMGNPQGSRKPAQPRAHDDDMFPMHGSVYLKWRDFVLPKGV